MYKGNARAVKVNTCILHMGVLKSVIVIDLDVGVAIAFRIAKVIQSLNWIHFIHR